MAKLKQVTDDDMKAVTQRADEFSQEMVDIARRFNSAAGADLSDPLALISTFACLSREAADMAVQLLAQHRMNEQRKEITRLQADLNKSH